MFKVGYNFDSVCIFTGGYHSYKVVSRTEKELCCEAEYNEIDGVHNVKETFEIHNEDGREFIVLWTYKGEEGRLYEPIEEETEDEFPDEELDSCEGCQKMSGYNCKHCRYGDDGNYSVYDVYTPAELGVKTTWR